MVVSSGTLFRHCEERRDEAIQSAAGYGLLRGACHRAALCADPLARNDGFGIRRQFSFSIAIATPWPTPTHMVASARLPPRFSMPCTAVIASRAPLMPRG